MTKKGEPLHSLASSIRTILGWLGANFGSRLKRERAASSRSKCGPITLSATDSPLALFARYTVPMPPRPNSLMMVYWQNVCMLG